MSGFNKKLRERAASWDSANAPEGLPTCPNCVLRVKADEHFGDDMWWCIARPVLPEFTGAYLHQNMGKPKGAVGMPINLKLFDPASGYEMNDRTCPLFEGRNVV